MDILSSTLLSLFLLASAAGLMVLHVRAWRMAQRLPPDSGEQDYRWRQYRRRMQTSAMLALLALGILVSPWITGPPLWVLAFWGAVLLVLGWLGLLAMVDIIATKFHFGRMQQHCLLEQAKLQAQMRRIGDPRGNGKKGE